MQRVYLNTLYSTAHLLLVAHICFWKALRCNVILIASIRTLIIFYQSFKVKFPQLVSYPGSSHRPASIVLQKCKLMKDLFPLLWQLPTSLVPTKQAGSAKSRSEAYREWGGNLHLLPPSLLPPPSPYTEFVVMLMCQDIYTGLGVV